MANIGSPPRHIAYRVAYVNKLRSFARFVKLITRKGKSKVRNPDPHIELPYTYLVAWFVMHYGRLSRLLLFMAPEIQ